MPVIVSIFFFVVYYTIESFGDNMLRSETIPVWLGMWLSNLVLLPVGLFLTYKSNQDSSSLNAEAYVMFFRKLFGYRGVRNVEYQEVSIEEVDYKQATLDLGTLLEQTETLRTSPLFQSPIIRVWSNGSDQAKLRDLSTALDDLVESLRHSTSRLLVSKLKDLPLLPKHFSPLLPEQSKYGWIMSFILPYSIPMTLYFSRLRKHLLGDLETTKRTLLALQEEVVAIQKGTREKENQSDETNPIYANQLQPNLS